MSVHEWLRDATRYDLGIRPPPPSIMRSWVAARARVAELVDALDLESSGATRGSSSLPFRTNQAELWDERSNFKEL